MAAYGTSANWETSSVRIFSAPIPSELSQGELLKPEPCQSCALEPRCFGIRRGYVALHGAGELRPFTEPFTERRG